MRRSRLSQRSSINTSTSCIITTIKPTNLTMSFTASSPARVSAGVDVVAECSMRFVSPWNFTPQSFGLAQSPSYVVATAAPSQIVGDDLVIVEAPAVETSVVEQLFLDNEKEIEFLGQKGTVNTEVESEVDEPFSRFTVCGLPLESMLWLGVELTRQ